MQEGQVRPGNVLKVDCFLNHQLDVDLLDKVGEEFYRIFKDDGINKILTIEASGIAIACLSSLPRRPRARTLTARSTPPPFIPTPMAVIMTSRCPRSFSPPLTRC